MSETSRRRALKIRMILLDVDGVLTDGRILLGDDGVELKAFDVRDGHGIKLAQKADIEVGFLTSRKSSVVDRRAAELGVSLLFQQAADKGGVFRKILQARKIRREEVAYLGDDLVDLPVLRQVGLAGAVADAPLEVKAAAHWRAKSRGGRGAAREFIEFILKAQGRWQEIVKELHG
ncbi:MAG: HAD hydrolase family protein [Candidatus Tectomicrobia bacterium]|uniref:3-deoxy-D-manno-octulosonate 8-phosphate phosphatase KdsC n=1 Tax=Tectimicrobiota bacterium TaxID=2528274 RepID=A0A932GRA0_UNCTE|nr:HAD hydrolase family protein [Candidatus Tectomicrobia bacterium]